MIYNVHNLKEGSRPVPNGYSSWLDYWKKATGNTGLIICHRIDCLNGGSFAEDGAHVQLDTPSNNKWYVSPLCHKCNCQYGAHFKVNGPLVSITDANDILW